MLERVLALSVFLALGMQPAVVAQEARVSIEDDVDKKRLVIRIGPVDLPAGADADAAHEHGGHAGIFPPVETVELPRHAYIYGFDYEVVNGNGEQVTPAVIHHLNLIDPEHRELFLPISQRMAAVGKETGKQAMPRLLFGYPVAAGQPMVVSAMLHNPTPKAHRDVEVKFYLNYVPVGRPWPLFEVYPFQLDVAFPAGGKSFDLPPGESTASYEARPALEGRLLAIGGHLHEYARHIRFEDVTAGEIIWEGQPIEEEGELVGVDVGRLYRKLGVELSPDHVYRVSVTYDNPTGETIPEGGMGVVGGIFRPSGGYAWPRADRENLWYALDRAHYMRQIQVDRVSTEEEARELLAELDSGAMEAIQGGHQHSDEDGAHEGH